MAKRLSKAEQLRIHEIETAKEHINTAGARLRDSILGGQDGLVNVLGIVLGVAAAVTDIRIVLLSGLAATVAESLSMGAVVYTSLKAENEVYEKERKREEYEIERYPEAEKREIKEVFRKHGFKGKELNHIVEKITSNKATWLNIMMSEELGLKNKAEEPLRSGIRVFVAALVGSLVPILPFLFLPLEPAVQVHLWDLAIRLPPASIGALLLSGGALFITGVYKSKFTLVSWKRSGLELTIIGLVAAVGGYLVGIAFTVV